MFLFVANAFSVASAVVPMSVTAIAATITIYLVFTLGSREESFVYLQ